MKFTEHEMTEAVNGASKAVIAAQHPDREADGFDIEHVWGEMPKFERYQVISKLGDFILPAMIALPDVDVEPGTRPTFTGQQVKTAVMAAVLADAERRQETLRDTELAEAVAARIPFVKEALLHLPVRLDADGLLTEGFTVPDTLEGL